MSAPFGLFQQHISLMHGWVPTTVQTLAAAALLVAVTGRRRRWLPLVASGVQTPAQLEMLRTLGCTLAQGPLLCGPIDASALTRRIRSGECMPRSLGSACRSASPLNA